MRIVSQDKTEDIPYELSRLYISNVHTGTIYAELAGISDATLLGDYYTEGDAMTALAEVRRRYFSGKKFFIMPSADEVAKGRLNSEEKTILEKASEIICGEREKDYGDSNSSLDNIAVAWSAYLSACMNSDIEIAGDDVANMMIMLKCIRQCHGDGKMDNFIDMAGYAAIGGEAWSRYAKIHLDEGQQG